LALGGLSGVPPRAVLLDALGTLLELEDPGPPLAAQLARLGAEVPVDDARRAVLEEMTYYKAHHDEASDRERLADLRLRCAEVLRRALPPAARELGIDPLVAALLAALRFRPYDEVPAALAALRAAGLTLVVVSNWDISLHDQLAATGLAQQVDGAVSSAEVGVGKPHPEIYVRALELAGAVAADAVMVGDSPDTDIAGARALGIAAVLVDRLGTAAAAPGAHRICTLAELPALIESLA
jgi:putative hydrolase of the HAD superfamily